MLADNFGRKFWWTVLLDSLIYSFGGQFWWTVWLTFFVDSFGGQFQDSFDTFAVDAGLHQLLIFHVDRDFMLTALVTEYNTIPDPSILFRRGK